MRSGKSEIIEIISQTIKHHCITIYFTRELRAKLINIAFQELEDIELNLQLPKASRTLRFDKRSARSIKSRVYTANPTILQLYDWSPFSVK